MPAKPHTTLITRVTVGILTLSLCACTWFKKKDQATASATARPGTPRVINLYIWAQYTSPEMLADFTRRTGIEVRESNYSSNEELLAKLQAGAGGFDVVVPSDYMVTAMIKLGLIREIDKSKIANVGNVDRKFLGKPYDPDNKWSLPYAWAITGIAVNTDAYPVPVTSWRDLLQNDRVKGRVSLLDDVREGMAAALQLNGLSLNSTNKDDLNRAKSVLSAAKPNIKAFNSTPLNLLSGGEVVMAHMYSGEALVAARDSGKAIKFVVPKEGGTLSIDNMVIPKDAAHVDEAYELLNYFYEATTQADFVKRMLSGPVVTGTRAILPASLRDNPIIYPSDEVLTHCEMMRDLGEATTEYDRIWAEIKANSH